MFLKDILSQALAVAFVIAFNYVLSLWLDHRLVSCWWGVFALWILIDTEGNYNDLKMLRATYDDLLQRHVEQGLDNKYMLKQKYEQNRNLSNILRVNNEMLGAIRRKLEPEVLTNYSPIYFFKSSRTLKMVPRNRLSLMGKSSIYRC